MDIIPLGERLIVKQKEIPKTIGVIYVPENTKELEPTEGLVIAIGDEVTRVKVGDAIYYGKYAGFQFERDSQKYMFLTEEDILGKIK